MPLRLAIGGEPLFLTAMSDFRVCPEMASLHHYRWSEYGGSLFGDKHDTLCYSVPHLYIFKAGNGPQNVEPPGNASHDL